jgi:ATP-dependent helicase HepA
MGELTESELTPLDGVGSTSSASSPLEALLHLHHEGYATFQRRETLLETYLQALRGGLGVRALLSSRIDLMPHQAYVAGVILLDRQQRYILADEVGLGKTIEAGIVIHDLLSRKPDSRILVLCPGSLVQQWFCEIYAKFCGRVFRLPELSTTTRESNAIGCAQKILSFFGANQRHKQLLSTSWDLVIVDEAHHLLATQHLYDLTRELSRSAGGLLLLSALPAQHREEEYLRLLALLEPNRYQPDRPGEVERFRELYRRQQELGVVLRWVSRRLPDVVEGDRKPEELIERLRELTTWPVLDGDEKLQTLVKALNGSSKTFDDDIKTVLHHVGDTYRINRRILRNRRVRLVAEGKVQSIERRLKKLTYEPDPFEADAWEFVRRLLTELSQHDLGDALVPLSRLLFQACVDPVCLTEVLELALRTEREQITEDKEVFALDSVAGYGDYEPRATTLWHAAWRVMGEGAFRKAREAAATWRRVEENRGRFQMLMTFLKKKHSAEPRSKFLIFAGFPGLAKRLHDELCAHFPSKQIARFYFGMPDRDKEDQVRLFRRYAETWVLVSDETGGEGRNFQFADEIIHFDTPWHAARVEQRIGRLDRLGRGRCDVVSNVLCAAGTEEAGLIAAFADGFGLFSKSISGLEFALRDVERDLVYTALAEGSDGLASKAQIIREIAAKERAEDESADLFDEASNERRAADAFRRAQSDPERENALERAFITYFKHIAPGDSVRPIRHAEYPEGIFRFYPNDVRDVSLALPQDTDGRNLSEPEGTFYRELAQERPDLEFFSAGNAFFDAVCGSLFTAVAGRTYAIETTLVPGELRVFEFTFRVVPGRALLADEPGLFNQLDRIFAHRIERVWVKDDGTPATTPERLLTLRRSCQKANKDRSWWNLTKEKAAAIEQFYSQRSWMQVVYDCFGVAQRIAREGFESLLAETLQAERMRLSEQQRQLNALRLPGWTEESAALQRLLAALDNWTVELDTVGFLSVNGRVFHSR